MKKYEAYAYTDGSYKEKIFTYGLVLFDTKNKDCYKLNGKFNDPDWAKMHNVSGEIMGVVKAILLARKINLKSILIFHDYEGLSKWINKEWEAKNKNTKIYRNFVFDQKKEILIDFQWVKAHSANKYNDLADKLATAAYKNKEIIKSLL